MTRMLNSGELRKAAAARRAYAIARTELRHASVPRAFTASAPVSMAVKVRNPELDRLVQDWLAIRAANRL